MFLLTHVFWSVNEKKRFLKTTRLPVDVNYFFFFITSEQYKYTVESGNRAKIVFFNFGSWDCI